MSQEKQYLDLLEKLIKAPFKGDRTGTGTHSIFGAQMRFDLSKDFPLLTTKKVHFKAVVAELIWFLSGDTNIKYLLENDVHIWTDWRLKEYNNLRKRMGSLPVTQQEFEVSILNSEVFADQWGNCGLIYGHQWRKFGESDPCSINTQDGFDQIAWVINEIKTNPDSRRLIVNSWNPHDVDNADLPPCHTLFQFFVQDGKLSCQLYQRSADMFLGVPFNIASYALLTHMVAHVCNLQVGEFIWSGGDVHLYSNHIEQAKEQLSREPLQMPDIELNQSVTSIFDFTLADIELVGYQSHAAIKGAVAV